MNASSIVDIGTDYLASEDTQMIISMFTIPFWPFFCNIWLEYYNENMKELSTIEKDAELGASISSIFWFQFILQLFQLVFFIYVFNLPIKPNDEYPFLSKDILYFLRKNNRYIMYVLTLTYSYFIPLIASAHWGLNWYTNTDPDNLYKAWNLVYPLSGIC